MSSLPRALGSFTNWAILRVGEIVWLVCGLLFILARRDRLDVFFQAAALCLLFGPPFYFHPFAFGFADDEGITFCRYFKLHFVPWNEVIRIQRRQWNAFELVVLLGKRVTLTKAVKFPMSLSREEIKSTFRNSWTPEIVTWLMAHLPPPPAPKVQDSLPPHANR